MPTLIQGHIKRNFGGNIVPVKLCPWQSRAAKRQVLALAAFWSSQAPFSLKTLPLLLRRAQSIAQWACRAGGSGGRWRQRFDHHNQLSVLVGAYHSLRNSPMSLTEQKGWGPPQWTYWTWACFQLKIFQNISFLSDIALTAWCFESPNPSWPFVSLKAVPLEAVACSQLYFFQDSSTQAIYY